MITLERLRYFVEAATLEHVGRASANQHVSPSVISSAVAIIEEEIGFNLFDRVNNRIKLNSEGALFLKKAKNILTDVEHLNIKSDGLLTQLGGHYRVAASPVLMHEIVAKSLTRQKIKEMNFSVELMSLDTGIATNYVITGNIDFALVVRSAKHADIDDQKLLEGQFQPVLKKNHPLFKVSVNERVEMLNRLPSATFRTLSGPNYVESHPSFEKIGLRPKHKYFYNDNQTAYEILLRTQAWALMPDFVVNRYPKLKAINLGDKMDFPYSISLISRKNYHARAAFKFFHKIFGDELKGHQSVGGLLS